LIKEDSMPNKKKSSKKSSSSSSHRRSSGGRSGGQASRSQTDNEGSRRSDDIKSDQAGGVEGEDLDIQGGRGSKDRDMLADDEDIEGPGSGDADEDDESRV
jgi:hypothetical protein